MWIGELLFALLCAGQAQEIGPAVLLPDNFDSLPVGRGSWRGKPLSFRLQDGHALVEGDILIPLDEIESPEKAGRSAVAVIGASRRWPNATVVYTLDSTLNAARRTTVLEAMRIWQERTRDAIQFRERAEENAYVRIRRVTSGCSASVGFAQRELLVNLSDGCGINEIVHELGHTLGLYHTQSRHDRNRYLRVLYNNIAPLNRFNYDQELTNGIDVGSYDFQSVMQYGVTGFTLRRNQPAFATIPAGIPVGELRVSPADVAAVRTVYGLAGQSVTIATNPPGLAITVDGEQRVAPAVFDWAPGEKHVVAAEPSVTVNERTRYLFARWSDGGTLEHTITVPQGESVFTADMIRQYRIDLRVSPEGAGAIETIPPSPDGFFTTDTQVSIRAVPNEGFRFLQWAGATSQASNGLGASANPTVILLRVPELAYEARFTDQPVTSITSTPEGLTLSIDNVARLTPFNAVYSPGSTHSVAVPQQPGTPAERFLFDGWSDGTQFLLRDFTAGPESSTLTAGFRQQFKVTVDNDWVVVGAAATRPSNSNIILSPTAADDFYDAGATFQTDIAGEDSLWNFTNWSGDLAGRDRQQSVTVNRPLLLTANFTSAPLFNASATVSDASLLPSALVPGALMRIFVSLPGAPEEMLAAEPDESGRYGPSLGDLSMTVAGQPAPVIAFSNREVRFVVPDDVPAGNPAAVILRTPSRTSSGAIGVIEAAPALYSSKGIVQAVTESGSAITPETPAARGSVVFVRFTGAGSLEGKLAAAAGDGSPARLRFPIDADVDGGPAPVVSIRRPAGALPGVLEAGIRIPEDAPTGNVPFTLRVNALETAAGLLLPVI